MKFYKMQIYKITYPTGKIYIGKDRYGSFRYMGSPDPDIINEDFLKLSKDKQRKYSIEKEILWEKESTTIDELSEKEIYYILLYNSNNPEIGYNRWPKFKEIN
jgi:hypothetical protein